VSRCQGRFRRVYARELNHKDHEDHEGTHKASQGRRILEWATRWWTVCRCQARFRGLGARELNRKAAKSAKTSQLRVGASFVIDVPVPATGTCLARTRFAPPSGTGMPLKHRIANSTLRRCDVAVATSVVPRALRVSTHVRSSDDAASGTGATLKHRIANSIMRWCDVFVAIFVFFVCFVVQNRVAQERPPLLAPR